MSRRALGIVVAVAVALSSVVSWVARGHIHSPAEIAARTAAPVASPILVPVEQKVLTTKVVSRGTGRYGSARDLSLTPSRLKQSARVVTSVPAAGQVVQEGEVLMSVSGRPVFLLAGDRPTFRDMGPGLTGDDVRQLENALQRLGFRPGAVDGRYDSATGEAVGRMFRARGFEPVVATDKQLNAVRPPESELVPGDRASGGVQAPSDEVMFVPSVPVRVSKVTVGPGATPEGSVLTVTDSSVFVDGALTLDEAPLVSPGMDVVIDEAELGISSKGKVTRKAAAPGTDGADGFHVYFEVAVPEPPSGLVGASVRLTMPVKSTSDAVLAVPVSAISLGPDGLSRVQRSTNGKVEYIAVKPGLSADGFVELTGVSGTLKPGDMVVIGFKPQPATKA